MNITAQTIECDLALIRQHRPIIHNITNNVSIQTVANVLLAVGASPIMAHAIEELNEIIALANALVINIGTLDPYFVNSFYHAQQAALKKGIPIILDPVGAGATHYRTTVAKTIMQQGITLVRGNGAEILALNNEIIQSHGIDSKETTEHALTAGRNIAKQYNCIVVISGATDYVIDNKNTLAIRHGTPLFTEVTGMGCALTALLASFLAINTDYFSASAHGVISFTQAGEKAAKLTNTVGSFHTILLDQLHSHNTLAFTPINTSYEL